MIETGWFKKLKEKYYSGISNFFIINGNIGDYPIPNFMFKDYLFSQLEKMDFSVFEFSLIKGFASESQKYNASRIGILSTKLIDKTEKKAIVITYPEFVFSNKPIEQMGIEDSENFVMLYDTINSKEFIKSDNILIFLTESKYSINEKFLGTSARGFLIEVEYPKENERLEFIKHLKKTSEFNVKSEINMKEFARLTAGLTLVGIEDIYLQAESLGILKKDFILKRKKELISKEYGEILEVLDSENFNFDDFAGLEHLKKYHKEVIVKPMVEGKTDIIPKGLLYIGPPGTGKTHFARCLSGEAGISFVELKMSKILDKWVGESEKRFDKALTCIKSIAPVGVFIDEFDQAFSRGENENNTVNKSLFGMFLSILSEPENRGQIIWIGAANYSDRIDEALKRVGRFDKKIPFLPPNKKDRIKVFKIYLNKSKLTNNIKEIEYEILGDKTNGYTQAEIEGVVIKAVELVVRGNRNMIKYEDLEKAVEYIVTPDNNNIKEMIKLAVEECNDLEFLPEEYK